MTGRVAGYAALLAFCALLSSACSGSPQTALGTSVSPSPAAAGGEGGASSSSPTPTSRPSVVGTADTNPSDSPTVEPSGLPKPDLREPPAWTTLPAGWNTASWFTDLTHTAAADSVPNVAPSSAATQVTLGWSTAAVANFGVAVSLGSSGIPTQVGCSVQGFAVDSQAATTQIAAFLQACASADFTGSKPVEAQQWVTRQLPALTHDLGSMPTDRHAQSATPIFGTALYDMVAFNALSSRQRNTIYLYIYGAVTGSTTG